MNKQKWLLWGTVGVIVIVLVVWGIVSLNKTPNTQQVSTLQSNNSTTSTAATPPATTNLKSNNPNYDKDLAKYGDYRMQFSQVCAATPFQVTYTSGTTIMLDNRASIAHTINIGTHTYTIGAYDYSIVTLSSTKLPDTILVNCDQQSNVATILLQK